MQRVHGRIREPGSYQALQHFITHSVWDSEPVWKRLRDACPLRLGVVLIDDTGLPKKGSYSPCVQRQYSGTLGKTGNCQIVVSTILRTNDLTWILGMELYLPDAWAKDRSRCRRAGIPDEVPYRTKGEIALRQLRVAEKEGFRARAVVADSAFGFVADFRKELHARGFRYVVGVKHNISVSVGTKSSSVESLAAALPAKAWRRITWRKGTKGPLRADFAAVRVTPSGANAEKRECWLLCERGNADDEPKYYFSNLSRSTSIEKIVKLAHTRWAIEQNYQQLKEELGFDHFEGRSWKGWKHHAVLSAAAFCFLEKERRRTGRWPQTLPMARELLSEILVMQIWAERPDLQDVLAYEIERRKVRNADRGPPR